MTYWMHYVYHLNGIENNRSIIKMQTLRPPQGKSIDSLTIRLNENQFCLILDREEMEMLLWDNKMANKMALMEPEKYKLYWNIFDHILKALDKA